MKGAPKKIEEVLCERCSNNSISYRDYIDLVLYAESCGYYRKEGHERVGRRPERDFYTAESLGPVFAKLVIAGVEKILGPQKVAQSTFVEIAAEPEAELISYMRNHPFAKSKIIRQGQPVEVEGAVVIFANEWLDALPFHRLIFKDTAWRERGVIYKNNRLKEVLLDELTPAVASVVDRLPIKMPEGYELDLPLEAEFALAALLKQDWTGLILFFDYGKTWCQLIEECPEGTARTYYKHRQGHDLLDQPTHIDITCDVNWTPLEAQFKNARFDSVTLESQESFFVQRSGKATETIVREMAWTLSKERQTLMELIHPANMGQRFQVLWGVKTH